MFCLSDFHKSKVENTHIAEEEQEKEKEEDEEEGE